MSKTKPVITSSTLSKSLTYNNSFNNSNFSFDSSSSLNRSSSLIEKHNSEMEVEHLDPHHSAVSPELMIFNNSNYNHNHLQHHHSHINQMQHHNHHNHHHLPGNLNVNNNSSNFHKRYLQEPNHYPMHHQSHIINPNNSNNGLNFMNHSNNHNYMDSSGSDGGGVVNSNGMINNIINSTNAQFLFNNASSITASANLILAATNGHQFNFNNLNKPHTQINSNGNTGNNSTNVDESKCHVCGDKSTGSHFGGISCESCKAFFRRSVQRNRFEEYKCSYSGECKMNTNTRKICQFCRYKRCLLIGMRPKWVLSDDERHQKYGSRRKQNKLKLAAAQTQDDTNNSSKNEDSNLKGSNAPKVTKDENVKTNSSTPTSAKSNSDDESSVANNQINQEEKHQFNKSDLDKQGIEGINMNSITLTTYEKFLIDRISIAFYHSRKYNALDLNVQKKLGVLFQTQSESTLKKMSKVILANFIVQPVKRVITFAKLIPDFRKLDINDQMNLLQGGSMEIFICSSSTLYDTMANKLINVVSKDRNIQGNDNSNIQLDILRLIWSEEIFEKTVSYLKSMNDLKIDEATLILFLPLILFSSDRRGLKDPKKIYKIQSKYSFLLKKYITWKYGSNPNSQKLYNNLLLKLIELRTLHEMHSSILLDADPTQLEPFPLALILGEKEENSKIKVAINETTDELVVENENTTSSNSSDAIKIDDSKNSNESQAIDDSVSSSSSSSTPPNFELETPKIRIIDKYNKRDRSIKQSETTNSLENKLQNNKSSSSSNQLVESSISTPMSMMSSSSGYSTFSRAISSDSSPSLSTHLSPFTTELQM